MTLMPAILETPISSELENYDQARAFQANVIRNDFLQNKEQFYSRICLKRL